MARHFYAEWIDRWMPMYYALGLDHLDIRPSEFLQNPTAFMTDAHKVAPPSRQAHFEQQITGTDSTCSDDTEKETPSAEIIAFQRPTTR